MRRSSRRSAPGRTASRSRSSLRPLGGGRSRSSTSRSAPTAAPLAGRSRLLAGGSRTSLPRQQTLRGAVDWSYDLLSEPEQALLRRLAVFAGGFTLDAAEYVGSHASQPADLLVSLVDKSLAQVEE